MPTSPELPCVRCGRPVALAIPASVPALPTCTRCAGQAGTWEVRVGGERVRLDADGIRARLLAGTLAGTDLVVEEGRVGGTALAAHPAFRSWFLPGHPDALVLPTRPAVVKGGAAGEKAAGAAAAAKDAGAGKGRGLVVGLGLVALLAAGAAVFVLGPGRTREAPPAEVVGAAVAPPVEVTAPAPEVAPEVVEAVAPEAAEGALDALIARVGRVEEPRAALLAEAWARRNQGTAEGRAAAVAAAEKAVARAPTDPEALATLAALHAEAGTEPGLRTLLVARAKEAAPSAPAARRAAALVALADGAPAEARKIAEACARDVPGDLLCREALVLASDALATAPKPAEAENLLYGYDELARAWPENRVLPRRAALFAGRADVLGAEGRLEAEAKRAPKDPELLSARAILAFRNGASRQGRALLAKLREPDDAVLLEAAGDAIGRGEYAEALALLAKRDADPPGREALRYEAQARLLAARAGAGSPADALAAAERLAAVDGNGPAAVQLRVAAALLAGDTAQAAKAWDTLAPRDAAPVDVARAWLARAALDLAQGHPREASIGAETALQADRSEPDAFLWKATAAVEAQNGPAAVEALRPSIVAIDGRHARRRPYGGALPMPADPEKLRKGLPALLGSDPARQADLALALAIVDWLAGDLDAALGGVEPVAAKGAEPDALALKARLLLAKGQAPGALAAIDQALAQRPKEVAWQLVRAEALLAVGRATEAEAALSLARSGAVPAASLQLVTARVAAKKGDSAAALVARRAAAAADPTDLVARRALRGVTED